MPLSASTFSARLSWLRSTARLLEDADFPALASRFKLWASDSNRLESLHLAHPTAVPDGWRELGLDDFSLDLPARRTLLGLEPPVSDDSSESSYLTNYLRQGALASRRVKWSWRIGQACEDAVSAGWWPLFLTLTVDPRAHDPRQVMEDGVAWDRFCKALQSQVRQALGLTKRSAGLVSDYFRYAAVIEHGKSRHHHHIHALVFARDIPSTWKLDPNLGSAYPNRNNIEAACSLWQYGYVTKVSPFWCSGCRWFFAWSSVPMSKGKPVRVLPPSTAGSYLVKYLSKDHKEWSHRIKCTRSLGLDRLQTWLRGLSCHRLAVLCHRPPDYRLAHSLQLMTSVPVSLLRRLALLETISRALASLDPRLKLSLSLWATRPPAMPWWAMLASVMAGQRPHLMSGERIYAWFTTVLPPVRSVSCEALEAVYAACATLFPPRACCFSGYQAMCIPSG